MVQREKELKQPITAHDDKRVLQIGQEEHSGYHHKLHKNASSVQTCVQEVGQSQVEICLKAFLIERFDFTLKTLLTEGDGEIIHAPFSNMNNFRWLTLKYIHH